MLQKKVSPGVVIVAIILTAIFVIALGSRTLQEKPTAIGFMHGKPMTREQGEALAAAMRGHSRPPANAGQNQKR
ncbi:MAG TPA: hypothetical protein VFB38_16130 [Chthonomonadaceae bacterium]|nr:hypothetical protein [Chthonomonadaceae bacterium]